MTADTITADRVIDLWAQITVAEESIYNLLGQIRSGDIDPEEAAAIVNHTISKINTAAK